MNPLDTIILNVINLKVYLMNDIVMKWTFSISVKIMRILFLDFKRVIIVTYLLLHTVTSTKIMF